MEKFIKKVLWYFFFAFLYVAVNVIVNQIIIKKSNPKVSVAKVLILGDSHFMTALNPAYFSSAINVSQEGEPYVVSYWKLKKLLPIVQPDTVLLTFSPNNLGAFNDLKFSIPMWASIMFERYYAIGDFIALKKVDLNYRVYARVLLQQLGLYPHQNHLNYIGHFGTADDDKNNIDNYQSVIDRHYYDEGIALGVSETSIAYLDSLINFCQHHQVTPILIGTPVHPSYFKLIPNPIKKRFAQEKKRLQTKGVKVIDDTQNFYPDSCYLDADHLNRKGSKMFMDALQAHF